MYKKLEKGSKDRGIYVERNVEKSQIGFLILERYLDEGEDNIPQSKWWGWNWYHRIDITDAKDPIKVKIYKIV